MKTINDLLVLCLALNNKNGIDVFFDFAGHVQSVQIRVAHNANYKSNEYNIVYNEMFYTDIEHQDKIDNAISYLQSL